MYGTVAYCYIKIESTKSSKNTKQCQRKQCFVDIQSETSSLRQITVQKQSPLIVSAYQLLLGDRRENVELLFPFIPTHSFRSHFHFHFHETSLAILIPMGISWDPSEILV